MKYLFLTIGLLLLILGVLVFVDARCTPAIIHTAQPNVIMETLDPSLIQFEPAWRDEIARRFPHSVGVLVHGGDFVRGEWIVGANLQPWEHVSKIQDIVKQFLAEYPDRTIVVLACNPGHLHLNMPGVYFAQSSVWCVPDRAITADDFTAGTAYMKFDSGFEGVATSGQSRWVIDAEVVGNIYEFVCD